ncbi:MAG TPA: tRNA threonylcarbamoyladenosine dehydratase [Mariprofundaceae bacterium]|nr:tRNA threonylcarbamoyladenosine dehydratase [Mariprofundaceae bacterium]
MNDMHERTRILIGQEGLDRLAAAHVLVVGLGGVGGAAAEAVVRAGIGTVTLIDHDKVGLSNLNRQLITLQSNVGEPKTKVAAARLADINPKAAIRPHEGFLHPENVETVLAEYRPDYVLDCIDSIVCKAALVAACQRLGIPVASSLGAGGRTDVTKAHIRKLAKTHTCGLARELRMKLRKLGGSLDYPVVYSDERAVNAQPHQPLAHDPTARPRATNGTISYMPNLFGFMLAGYVIKQLLETPAA